MARMVWTATGVAWALRSLLEFLAPQYFNPTTPLDHVAIWAYTAALLLTAPAAVELARLAALRSVTAVAIATAAGAIVAGVANVAEDVLRVAGSGYAYVAGFLVMVCGLLVNSVILAVFRRWRLAAAFALWCLGIFLFTIAGGGLLIFAVMVTVALRPTWFKEIGRGRQPTVP